MSLLVLLDAAAAWDAEFDGGLSNHLPMTLPALQRLGADDTRLQAFAAAYAQHLQPAPAAAAWPVGEPWRARLGDVAAWPIYRDLFAQWLASEDAGDVLRQVLPVLMQGCGAAAFHGLIRTTGALQTKHRQSLIDGLAYWACRWLDLGDPSPEGDEADIELLLRALRRSDSSAPLIFERMQAAAEQPGFDATVARLRSGASTLPQLARLSATAYAASGNFVILHLVTSSLALQLLLPHMDADDAAPAVRAYWRAYAAAVAAAGLRAEALRPPPAPLPWATLRRRACASTDEHVIKLVDSCVQHARSHGDNPWRTAATVAVLRDSAAG